MAGGSAGGMTASICALHAFHDLAHVWPDKPLPAPRENWLYSSWVRDISLDALLETSDLDNGLDAAGLKSALCCDVLDRIVKDAFDLSPGLRQRNWIGRGADKFLRVLVTLTNLRGVPHSFPLFGSQSAETFGMLNHGDYYDYAVESLPRRMPRPEDIGIHELKGKIHSRAESVVATLVEVDLRKETDKLGGLVGPVVRVGARDFGTQIVTERATSMITAAIEQVKKAFA